MKSRDDRGGFIENVTCSDVRMTDVAFPIRFRVNFRVEPDAALHWKFRRPKSGGVPKMRNFAYRNIEATGAKRCIDIKEDPRGWFDNVIMENCMLSGSLGARIIHGRNWILKGVTVTSEEGPPFSVQDSDNVALP